MAVKSSYITFLRIIPVKNHFPSENGDKAKMKCSDEHVGHHFPSENGDKT